MSLSDPIADFLTRLRNASTAGHRHTDVMWSKLIQSMAEILKSTGFIEQYLVREVDGKNEMRVFLKYNAMRKPIIRGLKRISLPGRRRYVGADHIPSVFNGLGISIISTSQGILSSHEARKKHVGGEVLCYVW
ncbi:MAG: 30S ribosomal protein S8 [Chlamydia sp.]